MLQELKRQKLDRDTLVMLSSDNGPWYQGSPGKLRGRKATTYEGECVNRSSRVGQERFRRADNRMQSLPCSTYFPP